MAEENGLTIGKIATNARTPNRTASTTALWMR
jgi:hypothetical protein